MNTPLATTAQPSSGSRGRLLDALQIATEIFNNPKRSRWVRQTVAPTKKITLGHSSVFWWEHDVFEWINQNRGQ